MRTRRSWGRRWIILRYFCTFELTILEIGKKLNKGVVTKFFPLHDKQARKILLETWANPKAFFKWQPIGEIRDYFGEYIALYFAYLGVYTESVAIAAALGIIVTLIW